MLFFGQNFINSFLLLNARIIALLNLLGKDVGDTFQAQIVITTLVRCDAGAVRCT